MKLFPYGVERSSRTSLRLRHLQSGRYQNNPLSLRCLLSPWLIVLMAFFLGCTGEKKNDGQLCQPGLILLCTCSTGEQGTQLCDPSGNGFQPCDCEASSGQLPVEQNDSVGEDTMVPPADVSEEEDIFSNDMDSSPDVFVPVEEPEAVVLSVRVAESDCDAEERADGSMSIISTDLELVEDNEPQWVGVRFRLEIPRDAIILAAFIRFEVDEVSVDPTNLTIHAQLVDDAGDFEALPQNISVRPLTEASVDWEPPPWETLDESHDTPSLVSLVNEIVTRPGWKEGNDMVFVIQGSGARVAKAFDGEGGMESAPLLHVEYLPPTCEADDSCLDDPGVTTCPFIGEKDYSDSSDPFFERDEVVRIDLEMDPDDWQFQLDNPDLEQYMPTALEFCGQRIEGVGMRFKKSTHPKADLPEGDKKNPIVLDLNEFNPGQKLRGLRKINLEYGGDQLLVAQRMNWEMLADFGLNVSRINFSRLYINGEYIGVFNNLERVDRSYAKYHFGDNDGQLYKHAYCGTFKYSGDQASDYTSDVRCYAPKPDDSITDFGDLIGVIDQLNHTPEEDFPTVFPEIWDVDEWIPTTAALQVIPYGDSPNANANNFYTYYPEDGGPTRFALWDLDAGYWSPGQPCEKNADSIHWDLYRYSKCYDSLPLFERMIQVPEWDLIFRQAAYDFRVGPFAPATFQVRVAELVALLSEPLSEDPNRYGDDAQWNEDIEALIEAQAARAADVQVQLEALGFSF